MQDYQGDGINLDAHITGDPFGSKSSGQATPHPTWVAYIMLGLLALLILAAFGFKSVRI